MEDLAIKNGLVVTPQGIIRGGLAMRNEQILQVGADDSLPKASIEVDANVRLYKGYVPNDGSIVAILSNGVPALG